MSTRGTGPLTKEHGVWVVRTGQPLPASATDEMPRQIREERTSGLHCELARNLTRRLRTP